jgi:uncharacterized repeat protein (TIGR01451 family)
MTVGRKPGRWLALAGVVAALASLPVLTAATPTQADLVVEVRAPETVSGGSLVTYEVDVENRGPGTATHVVVEDTLPQGFTPPSVTREIGMLRSGERATVAIAARAPCADVNEATNTARAEAAVPDRDPTNNVVSTRTSVTTPCQSASAVLDEGDTLETNPADVPLTGANGVWEQAALKAGSVKDPGLATIVLDSPSADNGCPDIHNLIATTSAPAATGSNPNALTLEFAPGCAPDRQGRGLNPQVSEDEGPFVDVPQCKNLKRPLRFDPCWTGLKVFPDGSVTITFLTSGSSSWRV